jgi:hypothetical protein
VKVYLSFPISGVEPGLRRHRVGQATAYLRQHYGWHVIVPTELSPMHKKNDPCLDTGAVASMMHSDPEGHTYGCCLRKDLLGMLACEGVVFLPEWQRSRGCTFEHYVATQCGLRDMYLQETRDGRVRVVNGNGEVVPSAFAPWWQGRREPLK